MPVIFSGNESVAYRDPAGYFYGGVYHLFFTVSTKRDGYMFNRVGHSTSTDLCTFSEPELITEWDCTKNFCSPGNVVKFGDEFLISVTSYPMPRPFLEMPCADETARLFFIKTKDFKTFSSPERIYPKGRDCTDEGRMIDPYLLEAGGEYRLYYKQNGISLSLSKDLSEWEYAGSCDGGENVCVIEHDGRHILIHSPENGIGIRESTDLSEWRDVGLYTLGLEHADFASGRITAGFAMRTHGGAEHRYALLFHGSRADSYPETHGAASLALAYTDDFREFYF